MRRSHRSLLETTWKHCKRVEKDSGGVKIFSDVCTLLKNFSKRFWIYGHNCTNIGFLPLLVFCAIFCLVLSWYLLYRKHQEALPFLVFDQVTPLSWLSPRKHNPKPHANHFHQTEQPQRLPSFSVRRQFSARTAAVAPQTFHNNFFYLYASTFENRMFHVNFEKHKLRNIIWTFGWLWNMLLLENCEVISHEVYKLKRRWCRL